MYVTLAQFNASLLTKTINFFKNNLTDPKLLNSSLNIKDYVYDVTALYFWSLKWPCIHLCFLSSRFLNITKLVFLWSQSRYSLSTTTVVAAFSKEDFSYICSSVMQTLPRKQQETKTREKLLLSQGLKKTDFVKLRLLENVDQLLSPNHEKIVMTNKLMATQDRK